MYLDPTYHLIQMKFLFNLFYMLLFDRKWLIFVATIRFYHSFLVFLYHAENKDSKTLFLPQTVAQKVIHTIYRLLNWTLSVWLFLCFLTYSKLLLLFVTGSLFSWSLLCIFCFLIELSPSHFWDLTFYLQSWSKCFELIFSFQLFWHFEQNLK